MPKQIFHHHLKRLHFTIGTWYWLFHGIIATLFDVLFKLAFH
ncbi:hypothetical protein T11_14454 [Trichinella zimbabwensis]|uniref:Uncharacterized protein n=1 Tax=Trichinella zimbabwensis TaxID=268475 RepID=A0A0V1G8K7_9BILA|nr:hypothetical protein T11_14454 [Trichinella zimbabwensis]